jgi:hypothetical protein
LKKLVYIMGAGRSGTTLLDIILGNNPGIFSAGELNRFTRNAGVPRTGGRQSGTDRFWKAFKDSLEDALGQPDYERLHGVAMRYEYHKAFIRPPRRIDPRYKRYIETFFRLLFEHAGTDVIVDSSKYPMRGLFLSRILDCETCYIYIKRNPRDVVRSFSTKDVEQPRKGWLMANLYLLWVHLACRNIYRRLGKKHKAVTVTYDELVSHPGRTLQTISSALDLDLGQVMARVDEGAPLVPGRLFEGNRIRNEESITIRKGGPRPAAGLKDRVAGLFHRFWWRQTGLSLNEQAKTK